MRNIRPAGHVMPVESFDLALPRQPQMGLEMQ